MVTIGEQLEGDAWLDMFQAAPAAFAAEYGLQAERQGRMTLLGSARLGMLKFNRVLGLKTEEQLQQAREFFERVGAPRFMVHSTAEPPEWLTATLVLSTASDRVIRGREALAAPASPFTVDEVTTDTAPEWAAFIEGTYGLRNAEWLMALAGRPGWHHYLARENGKAVSVRSMWIGKTMAWLGIEAPVPGVMIPQWDMDQAVCAKMVADGLAKGVRMFLTDIEPPNFERQGPGYESMAALGFRPHYRRENYVVPAAAK